MSTKGFSIVSEKEALKVPYPYIYVEDRGAYRELTGHEKQYLEEKFYPADGNRPYVKNGFYSTAPDGKLGGFLKRFKLPKNLKPGVVAAPKPWWRVW